MKLSKAQHQLLCCGVAPRGVHPGELVPLAAASARITTQEELENPNSLERLYVLRGRLQRTIHATFPVEQQVKEVSSRLLELVLHEVCRLEHTPEIGLPTLDPSFLGWKRPDGFPGFSIYGLDDPTCKISFSRSRIEAKLALSSSPELPAFMSKHYLDENLQSTLLQACDSGWLSSLTLTAKYAGAMPDSVRERIHYYTDGDADVPRFDSIRSSSSLRHLNGAVKGSERSVPAIPWS